MKKKYSINKDFKCFAWFKPPLNKFVVWLARIFWWIVPKGKRDRSVSRTKIKLKNPYDGGKFDLLIFEPKKTEFSNKKLPCLIYFHGGAFVFGAIWYHFHVVQRYAKEANCKVAFVSYRLAPKYQYPTGAEDCVFASEYILANADVLGIDKGKIAVGGDSAGGFLSLYTTKRLVETKKATPKVLMLVYPVIDQTDCPSLRDFVDTPMWNARLNAKMWKLFAPCGVEEFPSDWDGFVCVKDIYVETAEFDCLRDGAKIFADKMLQKGANVRYVATKGTIHAYDGVYGSKITQQSMQNRIELLKNM